MRNVFLERILGYCSPEVAPARGERESKGGAKRAKIFSGETLAPCVGDTRHADTSTIVGKNENEFARK